MENSTILSALNNAIENVYDSIFLNLTLIRQSLEGIVASCAYLWLFLWLFLKYYVYPLKFSFSRRSYAGIWNLVALHGMMMVIVSVDRNSPNAPLNLFIGGFITITISAAASVVTIEHAEYWYPVQFNPRFIHRYLIVCLIHFLVFFTTLIIVTLDWSFDNFIDWFRLPFLFSVHLITYFPLYDLFSIQIQCVAFFDVRDNKIIGAYKWIDGEWRYTKNANRPEIPVDEYNTINAASFWDRVRLIM